MVLGGVHGPGGCMVPGVLGGDPPDGYCCGLYTSYWNAFLLMFSDYNLIMFYLFFILFLLLDFAGVGWDCDEQSFLFNNDRSTENFPSCGSHCFPQPRPMWRLVSGSNLLSHGSERFHWASRAFSRRSRKASFCRTQRSSA